MPTFSKETNDAFKRFREDLDRSIKIQQRKEKIKKIKDKLKND